MSDDDVTVVQRTPPMARASTPLAPEERKKVEIEIMGGPHHGQRMQVWVEVRNIELPVGLGSDVEMPVVSLRFDDEGNALVESDRTPAEVDAVVAVYTRENETSTVAKFSDYK